MQVFGLDFTSAPRRAKPITVAHGELKGDRLVISSLDAIPDFAGVAALLDSPGPWIAGLDFPFGLPRRFLNDVGWGGDWSDQTFRVAGMSKAEFESFLTQYKAMQPIGSKEPLRRTDQLTKAKSPLKLHNPPVGKMYFEGARLLLASKASILPCRPLASNRIIIESYPAVPARFLIGNDSYKSDTRKKQTPAQRKARLAITQGLASTQFERSYHLSVDLSQVLREAAIDDPSGDSLDAILACIQAASASLDPSGRFYIPKDVDPSEGWIADPVIFDQLDEVEHRLATTTGSLPARS